ncbi:Uncharacterized protein dnm_022910 [Desulfonema magnum]|uniref:Uncharacterized protein n=1 Tax=Desulfonema magnum TaxID=45655 RepID=A0A975BJ34_9BACT|nr:Uncharacterized protein dnm_022910 [Desulfonema magnum]
MPSEEDPPVRTPCSANVSLASADISGITAKPTTSPNIHIITLLISHPLTNPGISPISSLRS